MAKILAFQRFTPLLFLVILLEGYIVLSAELLAIRLSLPFVDSGTDTISIIIAAVLLPLACGYYAGGLYQGSRRARLLRNLAISGLFLTIGLSYLILDSLFDFIFNTLGWRNRLVLATFYATMFLVIPVYLLGQTVPLISGYFKRSPIYQATGKILFFSTVGSFMGAVFATLFLMNWIGVAATATVTIACLSLCIILLLRRKISLLGAWAVFILCVSAAVNSPYAMHKMGVLYDNVYNTAHIEVYETDKRYLFLNRALSSGVNATDEGDILFHYIEYIENNYIRRFYQAERKGEILIIGAGGFTIGLKDHWNHFTYVDIDPDLKPMTEQHFLERPLAENVTFHAEPARAFLNHADKEYDLIIVDVYRGITNIPEHLLTREFFQQVQENLKSDGVVIIHQTMQPLMDDDYSRRVDNTIRSVFPNSMRHYFGAFNPWISENAARHFSTLYIARNPQGREPSKLEVYSDNLNRAPFDKRRALP